MRTWRAAYEQPDRSSVPTGAHRKHGCICHPPPPRAPGDAPRLTRIARFRKPTDRGHASDRSSLLPDTESRGNLAKVVPGTSHRTIVQVFLDQLGGYSNC